MSQPGQGGAMAGRQAGHVAWATAGALVAGLACGVALAPPAWAHPHVFIDAGVEVIFDAEDRLAAFRVVWLYDDFYTMIALDEYGMDPDFTGTVTEAERAELAVIYSSWMPGYEGDLFAYLDGRRLALSGPLELSADVVEGRLLIVHTRAVEERARLAGRELVVQIYDPDYFVAYTIATDPVIRGREDCVASIHGPDWEAADARLRALLDEMAGQDAMYIEENFPAVGADFADEVRLRCVGSS